MCGWVVSAKGFVERQDGAPVKVQLLPELTIDFVHVAVELFEKTLESTEHGVDGILVTGKIRGNEFFERSCIAVFGAPKFTYLA
jgi:hypothetical protein